MIAAVESNANNRVRVITLIPGVGTIEINRSQIPGNVINKSIATVESWFNQQLNSQLNPHGYFAAVAISTVTPVLNATVTVSASPIV